MPPLYQFQFRVRSRVFRWCGRLREIENTLETNPAGHPEMLKALDGLEVQVEKISVPLSYADELYALRNHIQMVRKKLLRVQAGGVKGADEVSEAAGSSPTSSSAAADGTAGTTANTASGLEATTGPVQPR